VNLLITEATMDCLDESGWKNFSVPEAVDFWRQTGIPECTLTHLSCHGWRSKRLVAGFSEQERQTYAREHPGLRFASDGMRIPLGPVGQRGMPLNQRKVSDASGADAAEPRA
jgi:hypothetical protein